MSYADHAHAAIRYGALALTTTPAGPHPALLQALQHDLAGVLAETTRTITGLVTTDGPHVTNVAHVSHHPVRNMLKRLTVMPTRSGYDDPATSPTTRLVGRPASPGDVSTPVQAWQGLVAETTLAGDLLRTHTRRMSDPDRWAVLADVAALAQVLAETRADVLTTQPDSTGVRTARTHAAALAVEAREVARLAGNPGQPVGQDLVAPRPGTGIVTVSGVGDLPAAVAHLTALIDSRACPVNDLLSISRVIALTSRACADALVTARTASPPEQRFNLGVVAVALAGHATFLARAVTRERADLIGPSGPTGRLLAQASEIGACALPRVQDLRRRPETARGHTPAILAYAAHAPTLTRAIRGAVRYAAIHGQIAIHDRSGEDHTFCDQRRSPTSPRCPKTSPWPSGPAPPRPTSSPPR